MARQGSHNLLERIYGEYHSPAYLKLDPLICVRRFSGPRQLETVGLVAACLAYGRVESIIRSIDRLLEISHNDLLGLVTETSFGEKKKRLARFKHRFNDGRDIAILLETAKRVLAEHGSFENLFAACLSEDGGGMRAAMHRFSSEVKQRASSIDADKSKSFGFLFPSPLSGSACKRLNMYFRWMVRANDGIDLGVWDRISPSILIMPVDVHVARIARNMGLTSRNSADWKMAEEITGNLRKSDSTDPVRYDFSLCRYGMVKVPGNSRSLRKKAA